MLSACVWLRCFALSNSRHNTPLLVATFHYAHKWVLLFKYTIVLFGMLHY